MMIKIQTIGLWVCLIMCLTISTMAHSSEPVLDPEQAFIPPWGKTLLIVGQDRPTINNYVDAIGVEPGGVMVYTSIQELSGLNYPFDNGAGIHHASHLLEKYPNSVLQLGLYMVGALLQINSGEYDDHIDQLADWIKAQERPVFLRIGYEFDEPTNEYDTTQYIFAWRRIVDRFRAKQVSNVAFVWHSAAKLIEDDPMMWYPGDEYVDWLAVSYFSPTQYERMMTMYWAAYYKGKPFMIAESSPFGMVSERAKRNWYEKFFEMIKDAKPQAVSYINTYWDRLPAYKDSRYGDARVQKIPAIKEYWLENIQDDQFLHAEELAAGRDALWDFEGLE